MKIKETTLESYFGVRKLTIAEFERDIRDILFFDGGLEEEAKQIQTVKDEYKKGNNIVNIFEGENIECWESLKQSKEHLIMGIMRNVLYIDIDITDYDTDEGFIERFLNVENIFGLNEGQVEIFEIIE